MTPETRAIAQLSVEADDAATKCGFCGAFGHDASDCPKLEHVRNPGVSIQQIESAQFDRALSVLLSTLWFAAGACAAKIFEVIWR